MADQPNIQQQAGGDSVAKSLRYRSIAYPSYTLDSSIKFVSQIHNEFTSLTFTPPDSISKALGLSGGAFLQKLSTATQYGLLQLKKGEGYKSTELFDKITKPIPSEDVGQSILECLQHPELYKKLLEDFKNKQLPSENGLANMLDRLYGVKGNGAVVAAKVFFNNISYAKLVNDNNVLVLSNYISYVDISSENPDKVNDDSSNNNGGGNTLQQKLVPILAAETPNQPIVNETKEISVLLQGIDRGSESLFTC